MKTYLICPVRGHEPKETEDIVKRLEEKGFEVHWPPRDVNQEDDTGGYRICSDHRKAMEDCDCIHIIWNGESQGCLFDMGMAFMTGKKIHIISILPLTEGKSFPNMIARWEKETSKLKDKQVSTEAEYDMSRIEKLNSFRGVKR